jgi:hypothetical protein
MTSTAGVCDDIAAGDIRASPQFGKRLSRALFSLNYRLRPSLIIQRQLRLLLLPY